MNIDIYVAGKLAGVLSMAQPGRCVFTYDLACSPEAFVSLTMPVRTESYVWHELHPVFQMNLPEGDLLARLRARLTKVGAERPMDLLAFTGGHQIGRVSAYPRGMVPDKPGDLPSFAAIMTAPDTTQLFVDLVEAHLNRAVSGVMPKAISLSHQKAGERLTAFDAGGLYKTGREDFPDLALNEWFCLRAAKRAGIEVPMFELSRDLRVLKLTRFDQASTGTLGFEDFAVLQGLGSAEKYQSTYERLLKSAAQFISPLARVAARRELFRRIVLCWMLRNGDAHLKNFALLYSGIADVRLAPLYDVVTTTAYPNLRNDVPALSLDGRRAWRLKSGTWTRFAQQHCALTPSEASAVVEQMASALQAAARSIKRFVSKEPAAGAIAEAVITQWKVGVEDVRAGL